VHGPGGKERVLPRPKNTYFRGTVEGEPESRVFLAVLEDGAVQGIVKRGERLDFLGSEDAPERMGEGPLRMREVTPFALDTMSNPQFACGNAELPEQPRSIDQMLAEQLTSTGGLNVQTPVAQALALPTRTARVAIETDFEFYQLFNNTATATNYIGNLLGYDSAIAYIPELATSLQVSSVSLWTTSGDPWTQTSTFCGLLEFGKYWNVNRTNVSRTIAHFLSGKGLGGGIAWLGVLCSGGFSFGRRGLLPGAGHRVHALGRRVRIHRLSLRDLQRRQSHHDLGFDGRRARDRAQLQLAAQPLLQRHRRQLEPDRRLPQG
jgi:hypothetical protein